MLFFNPQNCISNVCSNPHEADCSWDQESCFLKLSTLFEPGQILYDGQKPGGCEYGKHPLGGTDVPLTWPCHVLFSAAWAIYLQEDMNILTDYRVDNQCNILISLNDRMGTHHFARMARLLGNATFSKKTIKWMVVQGIAPRRTLKWSSWVSGIWGHQNFRIDIYCMWHRPNPRVQVG